MRQQTLINFCSNDLQKRHLTLIKFAFLIAAILLCGQLDASAQRKSKNKKRNTKISKKFIKDNGKRVKANSGDSDSPNPVTVINSARTDYLSGEASVVVNPKQPTIIRLGLAQNAVSIVEFPASDGVYYIHEGNPKLVSVFQSPTRESDRSITIYPGEGFALSRERERNLSSTITLQMRSGLILILEFVPVSSIRQNAHRCVINYKRDEIIAARRTAGLAYDLGEDIKPNKKGIIKANSKLVESNIDLIKNDDEAETQTVSQASLNIDRGTIFSRESNKRSKKRAVTGLELSRFVNKKLAKCLKNPRKVLGAFSKEENGLSLAVSPVTEIDAEQRLVIVAVKNLSTSNLRLVPGVPELQILSMDEKGNALKTELVKRTYIESTSFDGLISPGAAAFYAVVFNAPVMGTSQNLRVLVSHREAADTPNTVVLPNVTKTGGK